MPVQLTLRSPKGGRVLTERTYEDGYRIDAVSGWLVVVDRNGSVVAAHAACPGLEGRIVEHASAVVARVRVEEDERGIRWIPTEGDAPVEERDPLGPHHRPPDAGPHLPGRPIDDRLLDALHTLGRTYGPLGVAIAASTLTDPDALVARLTSNEGDGRPLPEPATEEPEDADGYAANLDALRAEVTRLTTDLDDAVDELETVRRTLARTQQERNDANRRAYESAGEAATLRAEVEEQTARAEREHAERLRLETRLAEPVGPSAPELPDPHSIEEDPRRPHPDSWPDDAVLLRYVELRRLVSLHLERYADARTARAMLNGDVPLRVSEVLA